MNYEITAISIAYPGTHEQHITHVWGTFGWKEKQTAVWEVWKHESNFFVSAGYRRVEVEAVPPVPTPAALLYPTHEPYLRTRPDGLLQNNLLSLPRVPAPTVNRLADMLRAGAV